ncbi:hypothetical protein [Variovorax sp. LjRoot178]|uniref:hypothetical protein n=1 Tax=Variovorax sp. LjRoot178 TaxID=3342277 RepID=UPI003ECD3CA3
MQQPLGNLMPPDGAANTAVLIRELLLLRTNDAYADGSSGRLQGSGFLEKRAGVAQQSTQRFSESIATNQAGSVLFASWRA